MPCSYCQKPKVLALGLCGACYQRQRSNGTLEKRLQSNRGRECSTAGCREPALSKGLCRSHYSWNRHPLTNVWHLICSRFADEIPGHWRKFGAFLHDVGERPGPRHRLRRIHDGRPYSTANVHWVEPINRGKDCYTPEERASYQRAWRLQRVFGIDVVIYDRMLRKQKGVCAICGGKQDLNKKTGKPRQLGVDHCHSTNKVRGLLCVNCNRGLGYFNDDIERLRAAIAYLERYADK